MSTAKLLVERSATQETSQDWGEYVFLELPSPGDRIAAQYHGRTQYLTVICVHHRPVQKPDTDTAVAAPQADVVAIWTSADEH